MRILQVSSARNFGGGERHFADLSNALAARGHKVFAALTPTSTLLREQLDQLDAPQLLTLPLRNALDLASANKIARFMREQRIEIVHAHIARDYPLAAYAARRVPEARLIITRHVPFALSRLHKLSLSNTARVIAVSESVARRLHKQKIFDADKIRIVPNGINVKRFDLAADNFEREAYRRQLPLQARFLVGTVGEVSAIKGQEDFVRAASIIARSGFDDVAFLIAGEDNSPTRETRTLLERMIAEGNLQGRVCLLGRLSDVAPFLLALDVYVSPSRVDAFGLALVEAMACGLAVVATETDGAREIIIEGATGNLVPIGDAAALAGAVLALIKNDEERTRLGERARENVRERFSLERMVDATEEVYCEALAAASS